MQNRRSYLILVGLILAAVAGVAALAIPGSPAHKKVTLGLDLQGGLEVVLKAVPPKGHKLVSSDMDRSVTIMRNRIDKLGVSEPEIRRQGKNQIVIELAGVHDPAKAAAIIGKTAELQFYDLENDVTGPSTNGNGGVIPNQSLSRLLKVANEQAGTSGKSNEYYLFDGKKKLKRGPEESRQKLLDTPRLRGKVPKGWTVLSAPANTTVITCEASSTNGCPGTGSPQGTFYYLFKFQPNRATGAIPEATGRDLKLSAIKADLGTQ